MFNSPWTVIFITSLFFVNCERTVLFSVKRDLDPPPHLYHPPYTVLEEILWVNQALCKQNKTSCVFNSVVMQTKHFKSSHISEGKIDKLLCGRLEHKMSWARGQQTCHLYILYNMLTVTLTSVYKGTLTGGRYQSIYKLTVTHPTHVINAHHLRETSPSLFGQ